MSELDLMRRLQMARLGFNTAHAQANLSFDQTTLWTADEVGGALSRYILDPALKIDKAADHFKNFNTFAWQRLSVLNEPEASRAADWIKGSLYRQSETLQGDYETLKGVFISSLSDAQKVEAIDSSSVNVSNTSNASNASNHSEASPALKNKALARLTEALQENAIFEEKLSPEETSMLLESFELKIKSVEAKTLETQKKAAATSAGLKI